MCALGRPVTPVRISWRRVHSPAAIKASATAAPSRTLWSSPNQPCSIAWRTRKKPPSASAMPPAQTTHWVPKRSSRLIVGLAGAGGGPGGAAGEPPFEPGKPEFEPFEALPRVHRHDDADHGEHRNGQNESDKRAEHVHQFGWRTKPMEASA